MSSIAELQAEIHEDAIAHGWYESDRTEGDYIALEHSELSEALEEYRKGNKPWEVYFEDGPSFGLLDARYDFVVHDMRKPEGMAVEKADAIIRILDWAGKHGINMGAVVRLKMDYNKTRSHRHGGKAL